MFATSFRRYPKCAVGVAAVVCLAAPTPLDALGRLIPLLRQEMTLPAALDALVQRDRARQGQAALFLQQRGKPDVLAPMIDALRYEQFVNPYLRGALRRLSGVDLGRDYRPWAEWAVRQGLRGPSGYRAWKAAFLARLEPRFGEFLDAERRSAIAYEEIQWGGVGPDGIPSLDDPEVIPAAEADYLRDDELVFGVALEDARGNVAVRAYPLRVLDWHEMTNDTLGDRPIALSYCTLCGSGVLFDRRVEDRVLMFATSGNCTARTS